MELKNFISKTVAEIINGLDEASKATSKKVDLYSTSADNRRHIEFDVAVTAGNKKEKSGGIGIQVLQAFQAGGKKSSETSNTTVSRIKFGIRISPSDKNKN